MIVSDLDGTLLSKNHTLSKEVEETIKEYTRAGGLFTLATGRNWAAAKEISERLSIELPLILCNGAVVADSNHIYHQSTLPIDSLIELFFEAKDQELSILLFSHDKIWGFGHEDGVKRFMEKEKVECQRIEQPSKELLSRMSISKAVLVGDCRVSMQLWEQHNLNINKKYTYLQSEHDFFEIVTYGTNKGNALKVLADKLKISTKEVLSIGNHMNDREMLEVAGIGVAVSNCYEELINYSDYLCEKPYGEGFLEAMNKFILSSIETQSV